MTVTNVFALAKELAAIGNRVVRCGQEIPETEFREVLEKHNVRFYTYDNPKLDPKLVEVLRKYGLANMIGQVDPIWVTRVASELHGLVPADPVPIAADSPSVTGGIAGWQAVPSRYLSSTEDSAKMVASLLGYKQADVRPLYAHPAPAPRHDGGTVDEFCPTHRHLKSGGMYQTLDVVTDATNATNGRKLVLYRNAQGRHFVRLQDEFEDGRFQHLGAEALTDHPPLPQGDEHAGGEDDAARIEKLETALADVYNDMLFNVRPSGRVMSDIADLLGQERMPEWTALHQAERDRAWMSAVKIVRQARRDGESVDEVRSILFALKLQDSPENKLSRACEIVRNVLSSHTDLADILIVNFLASAGFIALARRGASK